jgi:hypothetical protein
VTRSSGGGLSSGLPVVAVVEVTTTSTPFTISCATTSDTDPVVLLIFHPHLWPRFPPLSSPL